MAKTLQNNTLNYLGVRATNPPQMTKLPAAPTSNTIHFDLYTFGVFNNTLYFLSSFNAASGANWLTLGGSTVEIETITVDGATVVSPTANNVNLFGGTGITVTASGSTITVNAVGEGEKTVTATATTQMAPNTSYFVPQLGGLCTLTLPTNASCNLGDVVTVYSVSTNFFKIAQNASQQVNYVSMTTTAGAGGSITCNEVFDSVTLKYCGVISAVGQWVATAMQGTYTKV
jgi:hypothetical protein